MINAPMNPNGRAVRDQSQVTTVKLKRPKDVAVSDFADDLVDASDSLERKDQTIADLRMQVALLETQMKACHLAEDQDRATIEDLECQLERAEADVADTREDILSASGIVMAFARLDLFARATAYANIVDIVKCKGLPR